MKNQHTLKVLDKTYILEEPMTTPCAEMFLRLQGLIIPALGAREEGDSRVLAIIYQHLTPEEFVDISKTLVSWCQNDKGVELHYDTEFRGPQGMRCLVGLCEQVIKALYSEVFSDLKKGVIDQY